MTAWKLTKTKTKTEMPGTIAFWWADKCSPLHKGYVRSSPLISSHPFRKTGAHMRSSAWSWPGEFFLFPLFLQPISPTGFYYYGLAQFPKLKIRPERNNMTLCHFISDRLRFRVAWKLNGKAAFLWGWRQAHLPNRNGE